MENFHKFHEDVAYQTDPPVLWYIHYLIMLAFGKAFIVRKKSGTKPAGAEFFVHAMKMLPDITYLTRNPIDSVEVPCCAALYYQCIDYRTAAYNMVICCRNVMLLGKD